MDAVFGKATFRNEIVWKRIGNHNDAGRFGRTGDRLLFYGADIRRTASGCRFPEKTSGPSTARGPARAIPAGRPDRPRDERRRGGRAVARMEPDRHRPMLERAPHGRLRRLDRGKPHSWLSAGEKPSGPAGHAARRRAGRLHVRRNAGTQALPCGKPGPGAPGRLDGHSARELPGTGTHRLSDPEAAGAARADPQSIQRPGRHGPRPVLRLRDGACRRGPAAARVGRHRPVAVRRQAGQRPHWR